MRTQLKLSLACMLAIGFLLTPIEAQCQIKSAPPGPSTVLLNEPELYKFKSKDLAGRVKEAMEHGKNDDDGPMLQLTSEYRNAPDKVLVLLKPYLDDPNPSTQFTVIGAATGVPQSKLGLELLMHYATDENTGWEAVRMIYNDYATKQVLHKGGARLKEALLQSAASSTYTTYGYLLLSCYKGDKHILHFLQRRRSLYKISSTPVGGAGWPKLGRDTTTEAITTDLALSELGDQKATSRIRAIFERKSPKEIVTVLNFLKFVNSKMVLAEAIEQLHNKAVAQKFYSVAGPMVDFSRVCDAAFNDLHSRFVTHRLNYADERHRFTDAELQMAYRKYSLLVTTEK